MFNSKEYNENSNGIKIDLGYSHIEKDYRVFECNYSSLDEFLNVIANAPINYEVFYSPSSIHSDKSFSGTSSFEEAWNLCRFGQDEGYEYFIDGINYIKYYLSEIEKAKKEYHPIGYVPNVSKFLNGNPNNMRSKRNQLVKNAITIFMEVSYSAFTDKEAIINRGICVISLITYLEKLGYDCILKFESTAVCEEEMIKISVPIKRQEEKLNVKICYFPLVNVSFFRRLIFRAMEIIPNCSNEWNDCYGYPYKRNDLEILDMENTIYISTPSEMGIVGNNLKEDFDNFMNYVNEKYNLYDLKKGNDEKWQKTYGKKA